MGRGWRGNGKSINGYVSDASTESGCFLMLNKYHPPPHSEPSTQPKIHTTKLPLSNGLFGALKLSFLE